MAKPGEQVATVTCTNEFLEKLSNTNLTQATTNTHNMISPYKDIQSLPGKSISNTTNLSEKTKISKPAVPF